MPNVLSPCIQETAMKRFQDGPTVIQSYMIPLILNTTKDLIARSQTGSGKSAAFLLPIIEHIYREKMDEAPERQRRVNSTDPYAVIFLPTRELCLQMAKEARRLANGFYL